MKIINKKIIVILFFLPLVILAGNGTDLVNTELSNPLGDNVYPWEIFARVAGGLSFVAGTLALVFTVIGGYIILTAAGNSERFATGKKAITYAVLGLLIIVGSYQILTTTINILTGAAVGQGGLPKITGDKLIDPLGITDAVPAGDSIAIFYGQRIVGYLVNLLGVAVVVMYVYGGLLWMLAGGNEDKISQAKKTLLYATIGATVVLCSYILIKFVYVPFAHILQSG